MTRFVTEEAAQAAIDALSVEEARKQGQAKAELIRAEENRKQTLARLKRECNAAKSNADREDWARCQPDYAVAVDREAEAAGRYEYQRRKATSADALLSFHQTELRIEGQAVKRTT